MLIYKHIITTKPEVSSVKNMQTQERARIKLKQMRSSRFTNALKIRRNANRMLELKYNGENGYSDRLYK